MIDTFRIVVTGAHCTGKTTLCEGIREALCKQRFGAELIIGVGQKVAAQGLPIGRQCTMETYFTFIAEHIRNLLTGRGPVSIYDRFVSDLFAYIRVNGNVGHSFDYMMTELCRICFEHVHCVLYLPVEIPLEPNVMRDPDPVFQQAVDRELKYVLNELNIKHTLVSGNRDARLSQALSIIWPLLDQWLNRSRSDTD